VACDLKITVKGKALCRRQSNTLEKMLNTDVTTGH